MQLNDPHNCPVCGAVLTGNRLVGLCPACTWKSLAEPQEEAQQTRSAGLMMRVPGYEVVEEIARGGMGIVYRARQIDPPRTVALKMLLPYQLGSNEMAERFRLEVRALTELEHSAILPVYQVGEHEGLPFFTMKLATGGTLAQRKAEYAGQWRRIAELLATLAEAVHFAHEHGVLHRDLKPGNVLFDDVGRPYVSDFGLAKLAGTDSDLTRSVDFLGTPHYVAPEVAMRSARHATTASDLYSLGAILYELLAQRPPFEAEGVPALLKRIAEEEATQPGPGVPRDLAVICFKCLAKDPKARYATAKELSDDLRRWLAGRTILARRASRVERIRAWVRRNPSLAAACGLLVLVLLAAIILEVRANGRLKRGLTESLLSQARLQRSSGRTGQRFETISLVRRAAALASASAAPPLRTEVAAAMALPDVKLLSRWPVHVSHFENAFDFTDSLDRYAAATPDGGFGVFSTTTQERLWHSPGTITNPAVELRLSGDGHWAAASFQDGHAELYQLPKPNLVRQWAGTQNRRAHFAFAPSSKRFAAAASAARGAVLAEIVELESGATLAQVPAAESRRMAFDDSGATLAIAGADLAVWRLVDTNRLWQTPLPHHASALAWSRDGRFLAVALDRRLGQSEHAYKGEPILLFDAATGHEHSLLAETATRVEALAFDPYSDWLAAATWQNELLMCSLHAEGFRLRMPAAQRAVRIAPDARRLAFAPTTEELGVLEVAVPTVFRQWRSTLSPAQENFALALSRDGTWFATGSGDSVRLWDVNTRAEAGHLSLPAKANWLHLLVPPDNRFLLYSASSFGIHRVEVLRTNSSNDRLKLQFGRDELIGEPAGFSAIDWAADGRSLIVGHSRKRSKNDRVPPSIWIWPDGDPSRARSLIDHFPLIGYHSVPGTRWGVTADLIEPDVWVWNAETGERVRQLGISYPAGTEVAPNGRWLVTRTRSECVVWEVGSWKPVVRWPVTATEHVGGWLVFSPDSRVLAVSMLDGRIILRALPSGVELITLTPPRPMRLADWRFSPNNRRLFVLSSAGEVFDWNLGELRAELATLRLDWKN